MHIISKKNLCDYDTTMFWLSSCREAVHSRWIWTKAEFKKWPRLRLQLAALCSSNPARPEDLADTVHSGLRRSQRLFLSPSLLYLEAITGQRHAVNLICFSPGCARKSVYHGENPDCPGNPREVEPTTFLP